MALSSDVNMENYLSSPIPTPLDSPHLSSIYEPLEAHLYDFIPPQINELLNLRPHINALVPCFRENGLCIMAIPARIKKSNKQVMKQRKCIREI